MLKRILVCTAGLALAIGLIAASRAMVFAKEVDGVKYNDNDYNRIVKFLKQSSKVSGKTNAQVLGYKLEKPAAWRNSDGGILWNDKNPKRVSMIVWDNKRLAGKLDVKDFDYLTGMSVTTNAITAINTSGCKSLTSLTCGVNKITSLNLSTSPKLTILGCADNKISGLNLSKNPGLQMLVCDKNKLKTLSVKANTRLAVLSCSANAISGLNLTKNKQLTTLLCSSNKLNKLSVSANPKLSALACEKNNITSLDLSKNKKLSLLDSRNNKISSLKASMGSKSLVMNTKGKGYVSLVIDTDKEYIVYATPQSGAKFVNWTQNGKFFSKLKSGKVEKSKSLNIVANFK